MARHVEAMVGFLDGGAEVFDYGNSIRDEARQGGYDRAFAFPGFVPAYIRPLFCAGKGPFRWAALSGDPADIAATDDAVLELFPDDDKLQRWIRAAREKVAFQGLPARICWLGHGDRDRAGLRFNELVASGAITAPIVIGRDHLDAGSVASPYRETEAMADGSDAIADWPLLNALVNTASGATWVSIHHGGGVGMGRSIHAGQVSVADGTALAAESNPQPREDRCQRDDVEGVERLEPAARKRPAKQLGAGIAIREEIQRRSGLLEHRPEERGGEEEDADRNQLLAFLRRPAAAREQPSEEQHGRDQQEVAGPIGDLVDRDREQPAVGGISERADRHEQQPRHRR